MTSWAWIVGEHATHDRRVVFLTNKCQTLEGVDHFRNRQSEAHSFYFSWKLNPTRVAQESKRQVATPKCTSRFALAGTNTVSVVRVLCKKSCGLGDKFVKRLIVETCLFNVRWFFFSREMITMFPPFGPLGPGGIMRSRAWRQPCGRGRWHSKLPSSPKTQPYLTPTRQPVLL